MASSKTATPEELKQHLDTLSEDVKALADSVTRLTKAEAGKLRSKGEDSYEALANEAGARAKQANEMIQDRPGTALAVATGIGFVAGLLLGRK